MEPFSAPESEKIKFRFCIEFRAPLFNDFHLLLSPKWSQKHTRICEYQLQREVRGRKRWFLKNRAPVQTGAWFLRFGRLENGSEKNPNVQKCSRMFKNRYVQEHPAAVCSRTSMFSRTSCSRTTCSRTHPPNGVQEQLCSRTNCSRTKEMFKNKGACSWTNVFLNTRVQ